MDKCLNYECIITNFIGPLPRSVVRTLMVPRSSLSARPNHSLLFPSFPPKASRLRGNTAAYVAVIVQYKEE